MACLGAARAARSVHGSSRRESRVRSQGIQLSAMLKGSVSGSWTRCQHCSWHWQLLRVCALGLQSLALVRLSAASANPDARVELFYNKSNVNSRARFDSRARANSGVVRFLGNQSTVAACQEACLRHVGPVGEVCNSFTYHDVGYPSPALAGACFAVADHSWELQDGGCLDANPKCPVWAKQNQCKSNPGFMLNSCPKSCGKCTACASPAETCVTSGRIDRQMPPCLGGAPDGCGWSVDPVCLGLTGEHHCGRLGAPSCVSGALEPPAMMTVKQASTKCAGMSECLGFTYSAHGESNSEPTGTVNVTLVNITTTLPSTANATSCWTQRKFYGRAVDPYRTAFHFQPPFGWMNDPNAPMFYKG